MSLTREEISSLAKMCSTCASTVRLEMNSRVAMSLLESPLATSSAISRSRRVRVVTGAAAPGYLDERAEPFDTVVEQALRDGDVPALAAGTPARPSTRILYSDAPFGVAYLVATLDPAR